MSKPGYTYIMSSQSQVLYVGVTSDIEQRVWQHKNKVFEGFSAKYNTKFLVWFDSFQEISQAIDFEKKIKKWSRKKKIALIESVNPKSSDLSANWYGRDRASPVCKTSVISTGTQGEISPY